MNASRDSRRNLRAVLPGVPTCPGCCLPWEEGHACAAVVAAADVQARAYADWHATHDADPAPLREALIAASVAAGGVDAVPLTGSRRVLLATVDAVSYSYSVSGFESDDARWLATVAALKLKRGTMGVYDVADAGLAALASGSVALTEAERAEVRARLAKGKV